MLSLQAKIRGKVGRKVKTLQEQGLVPAVLYGSEIESKNLSVKEGSFRRVYNETGGASMLELEFKDEGAKHLVLIKDFQVHPLTGKFIHVDFYQPVLSEKTEATVPIILEGEAPVVSEKNGVLIKNISEIRVRALPQKLPSEIVIDVKTLSDFNSNIFVKDLELPEGVEVLRDSEDAVVSVSAPKTAKQLEQELGETEEDLFVGEETVIESPSPKAAEDQGTASDEKVREDVKKEVKDG